MHRDFVEMLSALLNQEVEFLIIGAHALAAHGAPRATGDLDIWVRLEDQNAERTYRALIDFGAPLEELTAADFSTPGQVVQFGVPPLRIDILVEISGLEFESAWQDRVYFPIAGMDIPFLCREDLITNKKAAGRLKDLADVAELESLQPSDP